MNAETVGKLRQPFNPEHIRWKVQQNPKEGPGDAYAVVVVFVDARTVAAHLDDTVPGEWAATYHAPPVTVGHPALECRLTVCGVTRADVGTVEPSKNPDSDTKDLYSDALKRAAVQFGVGAFLYRFPQVKAHVEKFGVTWYITRAAQAELAQLAQAVMTSAARLPTFKALKVSGYNPQGVSSVTHAASEPLTIGNERATKLHRTLGVVLKGTDHEGQHEAWVSATLGRQVTSLAEIVVGEEEQMLGRIINGLKATAS